MQFGGSMSDMQPAYYRLAEVEELFRIGRDSLTRWARAGIFDLQGENRGRRATGASVRAAMRMLEEGADLWGMVKERELAASRNSIVSRPRKAKSQPVSDTPAESAQLTSKSHTWKTKKAA